MHPGDVHKHVCLYLRLVQINTDLSSLRLINDPMVLLTGRLSKQPQGQYVHAIIDEHQMVLQTSNDVATSSARKHQSA